MSTLGSFKLLIIISTSYLLQSLCAAKCKNFVLKMSCGDWRITRSQGIITFLYSIFDIFKNLSLKNVYFPKSLITPPQYLAEMSLSIVAFCKLWHSVGWRLLKPTVNSHHCGVRIDRIVVPWIIACGAEVHEGCAEEFSKQEFKLRKRYWK